MHARVIFQGMGGLLETLFILTKGKKSINAVKNENVKLTHTQVFEMQTADRIQNVDWVQNVDCRLQSGHKMQTENLKSFFF